MPPEASSTSLAKVKRMSRPVNPSRFAAALSFTLMTMVTASPPLVVTLKVNPVAAVPSDASVAKPLAALVTVTTSVVAEAPKSATPPMAVAIRPAMVAAVSLAVMAT